MNNYISLYKNYYLLANTSLSLSNSLLNNSVFQTKGNIEQKQDYYAKKAEYLKKNNAFKIKEKKIITNPITKELIESKIKNISHIAYEVTERCNLKCTYCCHGELYERTYDDQNQVDLCPENALILLRYVNDMINDNSDISRKEVIISFYGGEALVNFALISEIVETANSFNNDKVNYKFNMTTNGLLLKNYLDFIVKQNFSLLISIDGDKHDNRYRIKHNSESSYDNVVDAIKTIRKKYPTYYEENVRFNTVLNSTSNT